MNVLATILSVLAAMLGVQKRKNLHQDFQKSSAKPFIIVGLIMTLLFILTLATTAYLVAN